MSNTLESIGFYTLSDERASTASATSPIMRAEILLTDRCNFRCVYCRGVMPILRGDLSDYEAHETLKILFRENLQNIRFTGGEPTLYDHKTFIDLVDECVIAKVQHIAISTNGTADKAYYDTLIGAGVNDFSISLDGACCSVGDVMSGGVSGAWNRVVDNICHIAKYSYVTLGMVFTDKNVDQAVEAVKFADSLGVQDIRVIPSAQYNEALKNLGGLPDSFLEKYKILKYRVNNIRAGRAVRGMHKNDFQRCAITLDDLAIAQNYHFPCVIYMREGGEPIGRIGPNMRKERKKWFDVHNTYSDNICRHNCLDVCIDYNNRWSVFHVTE
jgi:molybdenum cofactor biosynthesis enzyme MoaA